MLSFFCVNRKNAILLYIAKKTLARLKKEEYNEKSTRTAIPVLIFQFSS